MTFWLTFVVLLALTAPVQAETLQGPIEASYVSCYDADTCTFDVRIWLDQTVRTSVRLRGVDAPEMRGQCPTERELARAATAFMRGLLVSATSICLMNVEPDKYGGRVLADVEVDGQSAAALLIKYELARPYDGGRRLGWCDG